MEEKKWRGKNVSIDFLELKVANIGVSFPISTPLIFTLLVVWSHMEFVCSHAG